MLVGQQRHGVSEVITHRSRGRRPQCHLHRQRCCVLRYVNLNLLGFEVLGVERALGLSTHIVRGVAGTGAEQAGGGGGGGGGKIKAAHRAEEEEAMRFGHRRDPWHADILQAGAVDADLDNCSHDMGASVVGHVPPGRRAVG
jgi:hypothetical protein